jgi:hypothetical protein
MGWLKSGRFLRVLAPIAGLVLVAAVIYNATTVDRVPPSFQIKLSAPAPDGKLALTLTSVDVVFSEEVRHPTAEGAFSVTPYVAGSYHWQGTTLIWTPSEKLPLSATFKIHIAAEIQDLAGNSQGNTGDMTFTTVGAPTVKSVSPDNQTQSVAVDSTIQITFDRQMDTQKVLASLSIEPVVPYTSTWNGPILTITPNYPLSFSTIYSVKIGDQAVDTDGTRLAPYTTTFKTVEMGLRVSALVPAPNVAGVSVRTPIAVFFDGPIDASSVSGAIHLTPPVSGTTSVVTLPDDREASISPSTSASPSPTTSSAVSGANRVLVFTPDQPLAAHTTYTVSMSSSVRRTDGQASSEQSWTFTTGEPPANALNQIAFLSDRGGVANVWLMNPDGSNQRQVTAELVPVSGFDISGDGNTIAYGSGGVVKRMGIGGDNLQTLTAAGSFEYAPTFIPDGTALVVGRRDSRGADQGYWLIPLVSGEDQKQVAPDGAPGLGSVALGDEGLTGAVGEPAWAPRAAFSADGTSMLIVLGFDNTIELVDMAGVRQPVKLSLAGNSRPVWDQIDNAFYVAASPDQGASWSYWRVSVSGETIRIGPAAGDLTASVNGSMAFAVRGADGSTHLAFTASAASGIVSLLTSDPTLSEVSPTFSPDGSMIVFGRFGTTSPTTPAGIWIIRPDGTGLTDLALDGAYPRWLP